MDVISRDTLEWARDLAAIRELLAGDARSERSLSRLAIGPRHGVVMPFRRAGQETIS
jgi:hypothetical protein